MKVIRLALSAMFLALSLPAEAQQLVKVHRISVLSEGTAAARGLREIDPLRHGLRELGYIEGKNVAFDYRTAEGKQHRLPDLASELLRSKPNVIVATSGASVSVAQRATSTIPIVMTLSGDPVASGFARSLARPGGNVTGLTILTTDLSGKRLELLKEAFPKISRVAVLWRPHSAEKPGDLRETELVARTLGLQVLILGVQAPNELEGAFGAAAAWGANALVPLAHRFLAIHRNRIIELATKRRLPAIYANRGFVQAGGLMSYGPNHAHLMRRAAYFVDKILKGAKPADLPIEQPMKFELVINLKTAKQIGVTIPPKVLMWADDVIE